MFELVHQQIGRLDVAVDHPQAMGMLERLGRLYAQARDLAIKRLVSWPADYWPLLCILVVFPFGIRHVSPREC